MTLATVHPIRKDHRGKFSKCKPQYATHWGCYVGRRLTRKFHEKSFAKQYCRVINNNRRMRAAIPGARYSDVKSTVAGNGPPVAKSLTQEEYQQLQKRNTL